MNASIAHPRISAIAEQSADSPHAARASAERLLAALDSPHSHYAHAPANERESLREQAQALLRTLPPPPRKRRGRGTGRARAHAHAREHRRPAQVPVPSAEQLELFGGAQRWPRRPYCTDDLSAGLRIRSLAQAISRPYIQANPPNLRCWLLFDLDYPGAAVAWEHASLPPPAWAAVNRENGHAHLAYGLSAPVLVSPEARDAPIRYLVAVESMMRELLRADQGYSGLVTKNPMHPIWRVLRGPRIGYELNELAEYLPGIEKYRPKRRAEQYGVGRNICLFDRLRQYAYRNIRHYKLDVRNFVLWQSHLNNKGLEYNGDFMTPLDPREAWWVAKSVARWTWQRFDIAASDKRWHETQAARGRRSGEARRAGSITEAQPWVAEGISRATWYRRKSGIIVPDTVRHEP